MTRADKFEEIFGYRPATDHVLCNELDYCGESDACNYCMCNPNNIGDEEDWWNAEYKEPTTKDDLGVDAVSRQSMRELGATCIATRDKNNKLIALGALDDLPSVTLQEPRKGHWIANAPQYDMLNPQYICSECGNAHTRTTPYCEMCGAKMVELQESER